MGGRTKFQRPAISAPVGPVKNSRGPDLIRSDMFIIVEGIDDCGSDVSTLVDQKPASTESNKTSPRVTLSCLQQQQQQKQETPSSGRSGSDIASTITLETSSCSVDVPVKESRKGGLLASLVFARPSFRSFSTIDLLSESKYNVQDENAPPAASLEELPGGAPPAPRLESKLPRSRTLNVLQELKSSISRPSLATISMNAAGIKGSSRKTSSSSTNTTLPMSTDISKARMPRPAMGPLSKQELSTPKQSNTTYTSYTSYITTAQPSAYWSGRFVALHDRFASESFPEKSSSPLGNCRAQISSIPQQTYATQGYAVRNGRVLRRPTHLSHSSTTSALPSLTSTPSQQAPVDEDAHCRRVFEHLESLCTTPDAHRSLRHWRQAYARRYNRPSLLPEEQGLMGKIFSGTATRRNDRRSIGVLQQRLDGYEAKGIYSANMATAKANKRLSMY